MTFPSMFDPYLQKWHLQPDGEAIVTHSSRLLPVIRRDGAPAMLKIALEAEERFGCGLMAWWDGEGAAKVYRHEEGVLLMERAEGRRSLLDMAHNGRDDEASVILCEAAAALHAPRSKPLPDLMPLKRWFEALAPAAAKYGGVFVRADETARHLLETEREIAVLHGDLHHSNVLDFGGRGWLAIDPKRLIGERGFDHANIVCNADVATVAEPARFRRQVEIVAAAAGLERRRFLQWILAYAGLSAAWILDDGDEARVDLALAELAAAELVLD